MKQRKTPFMVAFVAGLLAIVACTCGGQAVEDVFEEIETTLEAEASGADDSTEAVEPTVTPLPAASATPVPEEPADVQPTVTPLSDDQSNAPTTWQLEDQNWYTTSIDSFYFIGRITNLTGYDIQFPEVTVRLYDDNNNVLAESSGFMDFNVMLDGETLPFAVLFADGVDDSWTQWEVLFSTDRNTVFNNVYFEFEANNLEAGPSDTIGEVVITGDISNTGQQAAEFVKIIAELFDAEGNIVGYERIFVDVDVLQPGQTVPFEILVLNLAGEVDNYTLLYEGTVAE
ncbi:MAG: hypothetical protein GYB68_16605 [Chloroflexi bacterium]|nr:hypothetical protein [Chloroflexota bacterium]